MNPEERKSQVNDLKNVLRTFTIIIALLGGIPYGIYLGAHTRISTLMLFASPMIAGLLFMAAEIVLTKKIAAQFSFYPAAGIILTALFLLLGIGHVGLTSVLLINRAVPVLSETENFRLTGRMVYQPGGAIVELEGNTYDDLPAIRSINLHDIPFAKKGTMLHIHFRRGLLGMRY
jgi:hypothetical protein